MFVAPGAEQAVRAKRKAAFYDSYVRPLVKEGGIFLCSGIIDDRAEEVAQCLRDNGWTIAETRSSEGWFSYLCR